MIVIFVCLSAAKVEITPDEDEMALTVIGAVVFSCLLLAMGLAVVAAKWAG